MSRMKLSGLAALYLAAANVFALVYFIGVLDFANVTDPAQEVSLLIAHASGVMLTETLSYIVYGVALIIFSRMVSGIFPASSSCARLASVFGIVWGGCLIASGMVYNLGMQTVTGLYATNPEQAIAHFAVIKTVAEGLGFANGEVLGGLLALLLSISALRAKILPTALNALGIFVGAAGVLSLIPPLMSLIYVFGIGSIVWFAWMGIVLLGKKIVHSGNLTEDGSSSYTQTDSVL